MPKIPERLDNLYERAKSGEPRTVCLFVSDDLDLVVQPPSDDRPGLIRVVGADGDVVVWPDEVRRLVSQLVDAALMLAEWR